MKKRIIIPILFMASMLIFGCKKENNAPGNGSGSASSTSGILYFKNTQSHPYTISIDGTNQGILQAGATSSGITVTSGITHDVKAVQYSGYWVSPWVYTGTATLTSGGKVTWSF